ncbi:integrase core domain protein, partial [Ancylostoma duodenale]
LKQKYGDKQALVDQLLRNLHEARSRTDRLKDQEALCEQLHSITPQLTLKGEHVDNTFLQKELIAKFSLDVQRHILRQKARLVDEGNWNTAVLSAAIEHIKTELKINRQVEHGLGSGKLERTSTGDKKHFNKAEVFPRSVPCFYCHKSGHPAKDCSEVASLEQRLQVMRMQNLCRNCGGKDHWATKCPKGACRICRQAGHHTSICKQLFSPQEARPKPQPPEVPQKQVTKPLPSKAKASKINTVASSDKSEGQRNAPGAVFHVSNTTKVLILAGQAKVLNPATQVLEPVYVILDTGADRSFISTNLAERLQLKDKETTRLSISTFGSQKSFERTCAVTLLRMWDAEGTPHTFTVTKIDSITKPLTRSRLSNEDRRFLFQNDMHLSINHAVDKIQPDILLGCSDLFSLLKEGTGAQTTLPSGLKAIPSRLGYLITGRSDEELINSESSVEVAQTTDLLDTESDSPQNWEQFCEFEKSGVREFSGPVSEEQKRTNAKVWKKFEETIERKENGYYVRLPWKSEASELPDNKSIAYRRLQANLCKLSKDPDVLQQYHDTITNQLEMGVIEKVAEDSVVEEGEVVHYLAHQAVITPQKETTKLRVVFDASAHLSNSPSLNDVLYQGPVILPKMWDILLRFRFGEVAITSDVEKAFLQVRLHPKDRNATRFMWVRDIHQPLTQENIVFYRFTRVTFGLNCSPFLLAGTILHHLRTHVDSQLAKELEENTYVDNLIMTKKSTDEGLRFYNDSKDVFKELNMNLREFQSNDEHLRKRISSADLAESENQKVLGVLWNTKKDELVLSCNYPPKAKVTKRSVSEQVAAIYDPLGWLTPLTLAGKRFLQSLWRFDYGWDTEISEEHQKQWKDIIQVVNGFQCVIPREVAQIDTPTKLVLFSDASGQAMATCAYLVSHLGSNLLVGKSKLPSIKENVTIPKLELNAITMATRVAHSIFAAIHHRKRISDMVILSDSQIALNWIASSCPAEERAGVLVKNRINEIRKIVKDVPVEVHFGYVSTAMNPADSATRGVTKDSLTNHMWWKGPKFILDPIDEWPEECRLFKIPHDLEDDSCAVPVSSMTRPHVEELLDWQRHNRMDSIVTTVAHVLRFIKRLTCKVESRLQSRILENIPELSHMTTESYVTAEERKMALRVVVRNHQAVHLTEDRQKTLKQLKLRIDESGIFCCRGRMENSTLPYNARQPIFIAAKTDLARAIVRESHGPLHCGTAHTMANVRRYYWVPKLRQLAQQVIRKCVPCQKMNNLPFKYPEMEDLPDRRVRRTRPFEHIDIDYFGPLTVKEHDEVVKVYGIIMTCTTTRLLHLELVTDMTTTNLLNALRRFFARRGVPATITSDNGPYFLLGEQILRDAVLPVINDISFTNAMATKGIVWKTITPYAPWQGAFYERLIKSVKHSLYKVMQGKTLTKTGMETLLVEIEGSLNTRPLSYQEKHWDETPILRPIDFIQRDMCWFCTATALNPECSPQAAIMVIAVGLYLTTALVYVLCYVPVTLGLPCRILCNLLVLCVRAVPRAGFRLWQHVRRRRERFRRTPRIDVLLNTPLLAVVLLACISAAESCQNVDIFELKTNVCIQTSTGNETCTIDTTQMLKLNTFHQQACFRIHKEGELLKEIRLEWKKLQLMCDRQTIMFTRNTQQKVVDSKRCPRSGSCKEEKCARINTTALLPELRQGNNFPGVTFCVESCGGPGCGCFYISSGCLFYRVYAVPADDDIYEIFRCPRWREEVVIKMTTIQPDREEQEDLVVLQPTVPQERGAAKLTLSSITIPQTPALQKPFITNGKNTAKWIINDPPTLQCASREAAESLECDMQTNCRCQPAENSVNCACIDNNITKLFYSELQNLLPIRRPWIEFEETFVEETSLPSRQLYQVYQRRKYWSRSRKNSTRQSRVLHIPSAPLTMPRSKGATNALKERSRKLSANPRKDLLWRQ